MHHQQNMIQIYGLKVFDDQHLNLFLEYHLLS